MHRSFVGLALVGALVGCSDNPFADDGLLPPTNLTYQLLPSGNPTLPNGILLEWDDPGDSRITHFVVYSRASTANAWSRRGETTSLSFHDYGVPHLQYYVTSADTDNFESAGSSVITVDERNRMSPPASLTSTSLDQAIHLAWSASARLADPSLFDYYRVYSSPYDLDAGRCDDARWALEGTTVSEDFLASGLPNGSPRCFAVSTVSRTGNESVWTTPRADTPRPDARNVLLWASQVSTVESGFRFELPGAGFGVVLDGTRTDLDFRIDRHLDGSLWLTPVRSGTRVALYGNAPVADLTSIDLAPLGGYSTGAIEAVPGYGNVFETRLNGALQYGAVRVTHVSRDYLILDWAYQTDPGNPELDIRSGAPSL